MLLINVEISENAHNGPEYPSLEEFQHHLSYPRKTTKKTASNLSTFHKNYLIYFKIYVK